MTTKSNLKARRRNNHNETLVRDAQAGNLQVKTHVRAGGLPTDQFALNYSKIPTELKAR